MQHQTDFQILIECSNSRICLGHNNENNFIVQKIADSGEYSERELEAFRSLDHPTIVKFYGIDRNILVDDQKCDIFYIDLLTGGSVQKLIIQELLGNKVKGWDFTQKYIVAYGVSRFLKYLDENNCMYRDIKPENILLDSKLRPVLCDLETVKKNQKNLNTIVGTPGYRAPEVMKNDGNYTKQATVFSFASALFTIFTGYVPYTNRKLNEEQNFYIDEYSLKNKMPDQFAEYDKRLIPEKLRELLKNCWKLTPDERPSLQELPLSLEKFSKNILNGPNRARFNEYKKYLDETRQSQKDGLISNVISSSDKNVGFGKMLYGIIQILGVEGHETNFTKGIELINESFKYMGILSSSEWLEEEISKYIQNENDRKTFLNLIA